jgi:hypothetical protein
MTAWLLYLATLRDSPLWSAYCGSLPLAEEMSPLLCYSPQEAAELQLPWLVQEAKVQHDYLLYQHDRWGQGGSTQRGGSREAGTQRAGTRRQQQQQHRQQQLSRGHARARRALAPPL